MRTPLSRLATVWSHRHNDVPVLTWKNARPTSVPQVGPGVTPSLHLKRVFEAEEGNWGQGSSHVLASGSTMQGLLCHPLTVAILQLGTPWLPPH